MKTFYIDGERSGTPGGFAIQAESLSLAIRRIEDINYGLILANSQTIAINRVSDKPSRRVEYVRID